MRKNEAYKRGGVVKYGDHVYTYKEPSWVQTRSMYIHTSDQRPLERLPDEEIKRGLCQRSRGQLSACEACKAPCIFGKLLMRRRKEQA